MPSESISTLRKPFNPWALPAFDSVVERQCTRCDEMWPLDEEFWYREAKTKDGFTSQCKACLQEKRAVKVAASKPAPAILEPINYTRKCCTKCHTEWPRDSSHFRQDSTRIDGLSSQCKVCLKAKDKTTLTSKRAKREAARSQVHPDCRMRSFRM